MNIIGTVLGGVGAGRLADALKEIIDEQPANESSVVELGRNRMAVRVSVLKSFLVHHLQNEQQKSAQISSERIRYRQVLEHSELTKVEQSSRHVFIVSLLKKVWMEDLFERCLVECQDYHRYRSKSLRELKAEVADKYLFELYQLREFIEAGLKNFPPKKYIDGIPLSAIMMLSDEVLHAVLSRKANQIQRMSTQAFSEDRYERIKDVKARHDLLKGFKAATYEYSDFANKDRIYKDLIQVLDTAVSLYADFQTDVKTIFGRGCQCDLKVKKHNGEYNVVGIRRMLVKWAESLMENDPELPYTQPFHEFVQNKKKVFDSFYVRSGVEAVPTHQKIIGMLLDLLVESTFLEGRKPNPNFGLFVYDLLRAKVKVETFQQLLSLLAKLERPKGYRQYISLLRVKNRLMSHNHDVLVNFRYGDILVAEVQISIEPDDPQLKAELDHRYEYKHFLYELQRSIFGPTMELIMIYQDFFRKDISAKMFSTGRLIRWNGRNRLKGIQLTSVECPSHHKMLLIAENVFGSMKELFCRFCFRGIPLPLNYLYCYNCSITYCPECSEMFTKQDQQIKKSLRRPISNCTLQMLKALRGLHLVFFHLSYSPASNIAKKFLEFVNKTYALKRPHLNIIRIEVDNLSPPDEQELGRIGIHRFPAFVLYKENQPLKKLFGMSVYKLFDMVTAIAEGRLVKHCPSGHQMKSRLPAEYTFWRCAECFYDKNETKLEQIHVCKECLYICCARCSFFKNQISEWFDPNGVSYLSTAVVRPRTDLLCSREHLMEYTHTLPLVSLQNTCLKCKTQFYFLEEVGMSVCRACNECICSKCAEVAPTVLDRSEYANHFVEMTAQEVDPCPECRNYFKKTYRANAGGRLWQCSNCAKEYSNKTLHLTCYKCDINYCLDCCYRFSEKLSGLKYDLGGCKCTSCMGKLQRKEFNNSNLGKLFVCEICSEAFYRNTIHYNCPNCEVNFCQGCLESQIDRKRKHIKVFILVTGGSSDTSKVEELDLAMQEDLSLGDLETQMRKAKFIDSVERGRFKLNGFDCKEELDRETLIEKLQPPIRLYYYRQESQQKERVAQSLMSSKSLVYRGEDEPDMGDRTDMEIGRNNAQIDPDTAALKSFRKPSKWCCCSIF